MFSFLSKPDLSKASLELHSSELQQDAFAKLFAKQMTELEEKMGDKEPPSLKVALNSIFSYVEDAHKKVATLEHNGLPLVPELTFYKQRFITQYFKPIVSQFINKFQFVESDDYRKKTQRTIDTIFEEKDWQKIAKELAKANEKLDATFSTILSEQKKIKNEMLLAEKNYCCKIQKDDFEKHKDLSFKTEINKYISKKISTYKNEEYAQIFETEFSHIQSSLKFISLRGREVYPEELAEKRLKESQEFLENKLKEIQKEIEFLKKTYLDISIILPTESEICETLKTIKESIEQAAAPTDKKADDLTLVSVFKKLPKKTSKRNVRRDDLSSDKKIDVVHNNSSKLQRKKKSSHKKIDLLDDSKVITKIQKLATVSDSEDLSDNERLQQSYTKFYEQKVSLEFRSPERTYEIQELKSDIIRFYELEVNPRHTGLEEQVKNLIYFPSFNAFLKHNMFDSMKEMHEEIVKRRKAIEDEFSSSAITITPSTSKTIISLVIPKTINEFPDFETIKSKFVAPFFTEYAKWFSNAIQKFKDIDTYRQAVSQILSDNKSTPDQVFQSLQKKYKEVNVELDEKIATFTNEYRIFRSDLEAAQTKYNFVLILEKDISETPNFSEVKTSFDTLVKQEIANYKARDYQKRFDKCLDDFNANYENLKRIEKLSINDMLENEKSFSAIESLYNDFHEDLKKIDNVIQAEIQALQKDYPGISITIPEKPTINFDKIKEDWITYLDESWVLAFRKDISLLKEFKLESLKAEIKSVEDMPLLPVEQESKINSVPANIETKPLNRKDSKTEIKETRVEAKSDVQSETNSKHFTREAKINVSDNDEKSSRHSTTKKPLTFDDLPDDLKENFKKKKEAANKLKLQYCPSSDQYYQRIAAKCDDHKLHRKSQILVFLDQVLSEYDDLWDELEKSDIAKQIENLIPYQHIFLTDVADVEYKEKVKDQRIQEIKKFEEYFKDAEDFRIKKFRETADNFGGDAKERELKPFDPSFISDKIKNDPNYVYEYFHDIERKKIDAEDKKRESKKSRTRLKRLPIPEMRMGQNIEKPLESLNQELKTVKIASKKENLFVPEVKANKVQKPVEPELSLLILGAAFCTAGVGALLYLAHYFYQQYHYQKQLVRYNVQLGCEQLTIRFNQSLEAELKEDKSVPAVNCTTRPELESVPLEPELNRFILGLSMISIIGPFVYLMYHTYENRQYNKQMSTYLSKCGMWSKSVPSANPVEPQNEATPRPDK